MTPAQEPLYSVAVVRRLLSQYGLRADKAFGQNFLVDGNSLQHIVTAAELSPGDTVLEIGPGLGVLTRELAARAGRVVSLELDERLLPLLRETLAQPLAQGRLELIHQDALRYDFTTMPQGSVLVANLPYNVGTPIVLNALTSGRFKRLVFLVQREVAERFGAVPGSPHYGALTLMVRHFAEVKLVRHFKPSLFYPPPEVTSSLLRLETIPGQSLDSRTFQLIKQAFKHRRKTLKKNLLMAGYSREQVSAALEALELDPRIRGEQLTLEQFRALAKHLACVSDDA